MAVKTTVRPRQGSPKAAPYTPKAIVKALSGTGVLPAGPAYAVDTLNDILRTLLIFKDLATVFYTAALTSTGIPPALSAAQKLRMQAALTNEIAHANALRNHLSNVPKTSIFDPYQFFYLPASIFNAISATYDWNYNFNNPPLYYESPLQILNDGQFIDYLQLLEAVLFSAEDAAIGQITALAWNAGGYPAKIPYTPEVGNYPGAAELMASMEGVDYGHLTLANELNVAYWNSVYCAGYETQFVNDDDEYIFGFNSLVHGMYPAIAWLQPLVQRNFTATYGAVPSGAPTVFSNAGWTPYSLENALQQARSLIIPTINDTETYY